MSQVAESKDSARALSPGRPRRRGKNENRHAENLHRPPAFEKGTASLAAVRNFQKYRIPSEMVVVLDFAGNICDLACVRAGWGIM